MAGGRGRHSKQVFKRGCQKSVDEGEKNSHDCGEGRKPGQKDSPKEWGETRKERRVEGEKDG